MKLTEKEGEFVAEMAFFEPANSGRWSSFDPPFTRVYYDRFVRKGWLEYEGDGRARQFRWTDVGRRGLEEMR